MSVAPTWRDTGWRAKRVEELAVVAMTAWFARVFIDPRRYVTGFDTVAYSAPNLRFTLTELTSGRIPLWNDTIFGGAPHLGNTQTGSLYLPKLLVVGMNLNRAMSLLVAGHLLLLGVGLLALMRRLGCRPPAGFTAALAGVGCGAVLTRSVQFEQILVIAWAPAVLVGIHAVVTSPRVWRATAGTALVMTGMVLAGHPQMTYLVGTMAGVWTISVVVSTRAWSRLRHLTTAAVAAGCLCGLQLLATRAATQSSAIGGGRSFETLRLPDRSIQPGLMARVLLGTVRDIDPGFNAGAFETVGYVGAAVGALAIVGVAAHLRSGPRRPLVVGLAVMAIVSATLATGARTALFELAFNHLPGFDLMRVSARWITVTDLALAVLAGLGIDALMRTARSRAPTRATVDAAVDAAGGAAVGVGTAVGAAVGAVGVGTAVGAVGVGTAIVAALAVAGRVEIDATAATGWLVGLALVLVSMVIARRPARHEDRPQRPWIGMIVAAMAIAGVAFELGAASRHAVSLQVASRASFTNYTSDATEWLKGQSGWSIALTGDRLSEPPYLVPALRPNTNTLFGIRSLDGYDGGVQVSKRWMSMLGTFTAHPNFELTMRAQLPERLDPAAFAGFGVRWVLTDVGTAGDRLVGWRGPVIADSAFEVYENPEWIAETVFRRAGQTDIPVASVRLSPTVIESHVAQDAAGDVVASAQWDAGWRASIDGRPAATKAIDHFMLGVEVPAGTHDVRFDYRPGWLVPGLLVMLLGVLLVMAMLVADDRRWNVHFTGAAAPDPIARTPSPPESLASGQSSPATVRATPCPR